MNNDIFPEPLSRSSSWLRLTRALVVLHLPHIFEWCQRDKEREQITWGQVLNNRKITWPCQFDPKSVLFLWKIRTHPKYQEPTYDPNPNWKINVCFQSYFFHFKTMHISVTRVDSTILSIFCAPFLYLFNFFNLFNSLISTSLYSCPNRKSLGKALITMKPTQKIVDGRFFSLFSFS